MRRAYDRSPTEEAKMAVAYVQEFEIVDRSTANYDAVAERVRD